MSTQLASHRPLHRNRLFLLFIIALFVLPLLTAWLLVGRWQPNATTNHGQLLSPAQPITHLRLRQADGEELNESFLQGHWTLVYVGSGHECAELCRRGLYNMRQVRLALGKDMLRTQTLYMMTHLPDQDLLAWLDREHTAMTHGVADTPTLEFLAQAFPGTTGQSIYLIDPLGNLIMRYDVESDPKGILDDLEHLLKLSKIG